MSFPSDVRIDFGDEFLNQDEDANLRAIDPNDIVVQQPQQQQQQQPQQQPHQVEAQQHFDVSHPLSSYPEPDPVPVSSVVCSLSSSHSQEVPSVPTLVLTPPHPQPQPPQGHPSTSSSPPSPSPTPTPPKTRKPRKKKDPNAPSAVSSAYAFFFKDRQASVKAHNPNAKFGEVSKIVASLWEALSEENKVWTHVNRFKS